MRPSWVAQSKQSREGAARSPAFGSGPRPTSATCTPIPAPHPFQGGKRKCGTRGQDGAMVKKRQEGTGVTRTASPHRAPFCSWALAGDPRPRSRKRRARPPVRLPSPSAAPGARPACASLSTPITYNGIVSGAGTAQSLPPRNRRRRPGHDPPRREGRWPASAPGPTQSRTRAPPL